MTTTKTIEQQGRKYMQAKFNLESINKEARTVDVTFVTEREVMMYNYRQGLINEILVCTAEAGDLSRLNNGGPLCDTHNTYSVKNGLGVVEKAWFEGGKGRATVRFSKRPDVEQVWQDVQDGCVTGISVGYRVGTYEITEREGQIPLARAIQWEAMEISLALVQADPESAVGRAGAENNGEKHTITIIEKSNKMENVNAGAAAPNTAETESQRSATAAVPAVAVPNTAEAEKRATATERTRVQEINKAVRATGLTSEFADSLIAQEISLDQARGLIIDEVAKKGANNGTNNAHSAVTVGKDETDKFREAAITGLCLRSAKMNEKDFTADQVSTGREFRGFSLMKIAADCIIRSGVNYSEVSRMNDNDIIKRAITSSASDFPILLEGTARRILLAAYQSIPDTWRQWCSVGSVSDFRVWKRLRLGGLSRLDTLTELGEIKTKPLSDATAESVSATTKANKISISRVMMINDDLDGFTRLPSDLGRAAARGIEIDAYALLASNPTLADGVALFHATHKNLATGAAMSINSFDAMRVLMAKQQDPNSQDYIDIRPSILLCDVAYGGDAKVLNEAQFDFDQTSKFQKPNKSRGLFNKIIDSPRIGDTTYYAFADPSMEPVVEVSFLNGVQTPYLESQQSFDQLGLEWRIYHDYGVGAVGFRGAVKNAGV